MPFAPSSFLFLVVRPGAPFVASDRSVRSDALYAPKKLDQPIGGTFAVGSRVRYGSIGCAPADRFADQEMADLISS